MDISTNTIESAFFTEESGHLTLDHQHQSYHSRFPLADAYEGSHFIDDHGSLQEQLQQQQQQQGQHSTSAAFSLNQRRFASERLNSRQPSNVARNNNYTNNSSVNSRSRIPVPAFNYNRSNITYSRIEHNNSNRDVLRYPGRIQRPIDTQSRDEVFLATAQAAHASLQSTTSSQRLPTSNSIHLTRSNIDSYHQTTPSESTTTLHQSSINSLSSMSRPFCNANEDYDRWLEKYSLICQSPIGRMPSNMNLVPLCFTVRSIRCGTSLSNATLDHWWDSILIDDSYVYTIQKANVVNILLEYCGGSYNDNRPYNIPYCTISKIVLKTDKTADFGPRFKQGMIFVSHKPIDIQRTQAFDWFKKEKYDRYTVTKSRCLYRVHDYEPVGWFDCCQATKDTSNDAQDNGTRNCVVDIEERSGRYILLKFLTEDTSVMETINCSFNLQYVGLFGFTGARAFAHAKYQ